ncbi:hypothetical protein [Streptomyces sp. NPDC059786]|uniref:hypothetical protein n=1 Tax=Streptomyces sp. NPDC059786 TaxID=3346946 RepID=UPI00365E1CAF
MTAKPFTTDSTDTTGSTDATDATGTTGTTALSGPSSTDSTAGVRARLLAVGAVTGLIMLLPIVVLAWLAVLSTDRGTGCLMYGEGCSDVPGGLLWALFWTALTAGVTAVVWAPDRWPAARTGTVLLQWGAQVTLAALIMSGA